jgi:hypothetical protein
MRAIRDILLLSISAILAFAISYSIPTILPTYFPPQESKLLVFDRPGGLMKTYYEEEASWRRDRVTIKILGDQYSAAAMQVVMYHFRGGKICTGDITLYFHQPYIEFLNMRIGVPYYREVFIEWVGMKFTDLIGPLTVTKWKKLDPRVFGIPRCTLTF